MTSFGPTPSVPAAVMDSFHRGMSDIAASQAYTIQIDETIEVHVQAEPCKRVRMMAMLALDSHQLGDDQLQALLVLNQPGDAYPLLTISIDSGSGHLMVWTSVEAHDTDTDQFTDTFGRLVRRARGILTLLRSGLYGQPAARDLPVGVGSRA